MELRVQKLNSLAQLPSKAESGACGYDLVATSREYKKDFVEYGTGIAVEIPHGYAGFIMPRSSISNTALALANSVGLIDNSYRGEIKLRFRITIDKGEESYYSIGERIGQLVLVKVTSDATVQEVDSLSETERGSGGFGSTGA